jgi:hypothetical protein
MSKGDVSEYQKDQLLAFFAMYMDQDLRARLMAELPRAYNAWVGRRIVEVHHTDGRKVEVPLSGTEKVCGQHYNA